MKSVQNFNEYVNTLLKVNRRELRLNRVEDKRCKQKFLHIVISFLFLENS